MATDITERVRHRVWKALSPQTAEAAGMSIPLLRQFAIGSFTPTDAQIADLARHFGIIESRGGTR